MQLYWILGLGWVIAFGGLYFVFYFGLVASFSFGFPRFGMGFIDLVDLLVLLALMFVVGCVCWATTLWFLLV